MTEIAESPEAHPEDGQKPGADGASRPPARSRSAPSRKAGASSQAGTSSQADASSPDTDDKAGAFEAYGQSQWPLASYAGLVGVYCAGVAGLLWAARKAGKQVPESIPAADLALAGVATFKASRLITKDWVLAPLRAPFVRYQGPGGPGEVREKARGEGLQHAVGELLTCPWCMSQWVATAFTIGFVYSPRYTRLAATIFSSVAISDLLNLLYTTAEQKLE